MASVLVQPWAGFLFAAISSLSITLLGLTIDIYPNIFTMAGFFTLAIVSWLITSRIDRTFDALQRSEKQKSLILDNTSELIVYQNTDHKILWANKAAIDSTDISTEELRGKHCYEVWSQRDTPCDDCPVSLAIKERRPVEGEMTTPDGRSWLVRGSPVFSDQGEIVGAVEVTSDITDLKNYSNKLEHLNHILESIRDINQIVVRTESRDDLLEDVCKILSNMSEYNNVWLVTIDEKNKPISFYGEGLDSEFNEFMKNIEEGAWLQCIERALNDSSVHIIENTYYECDECPLVDGKEGRSSIVTQISYLDKICGVLVISSFQDLHWEEEKSLIREVTTDIGYALNRLGIRGNLRKREQRYRNLINSVKTNIVVHDSDGQIISANPVAEELFGLDEEELRDKPIDFWEGKLFDGNGDPLDISDFPVSRVIETNKPVEGLEIGIRPPEDGQIRWHLLSAVPQFNAEGDIDRVINTFQDITQRKLYEEKLETMHFYTSKLSSLNDLDELNETVLDTVQELLGFNFAGIALRKGDHISYIETIGTILHDDWYIEYGCGVTSRAFETGESQLINDVRKDPDYLPADIDMEVPEMRSELAVPVVNSRGVTAVINVESQELDAFSLQDKKILEILSEHMATNIDRIRGREYERIYESRLAALHNHAVTLSDSNTLEDVAELTVDTIKSVFGFSRISFLTVTDGSLVKLYGEPMDTVQELPLDGLGITVRVATTGRAQLVSDIRLDDDFIQGIHDENLEPSRSKLAVPVKVEDEVVAVINVESPRIDDFDEYDRRLMGLLAESVSSAIERLRRMDELEELVSERTEELREAYEELKELDRMKDQFISMATHELRTPLVSIKGYVDYIQSGSAGEVPNRIEELLDIVQRNTRRLESLTDDLLDQQRIESGRLEINPETIQLKNVLDDILEELEPYIKESNLDLVLEVPEDLSELYADQIRIGQVLLNLIHNAAKFSPEGSEIKVEVEETDGDIKVSVEDEGIGLTPEDMRELFKPFPKIEQPDFYGGTGLGLSICKGIVELHGGEIWAESEGRGEGSIFTFTIPKTAHES